MVSIVLNTHFYETVLSFISQETFISITIIMYLELLDFSYKYWNS